MTTARASDLARRLVGVVFVVDAGPESQTTTTTRLEGPYFAALLVLVKSRIFRESAVAASSTSSSFDLAERRR